MNKLGWLFLSLSLCACGARTGLHIPDTNDEDSAVPADATVDATVEQEDASVDGSVDAALPDATVVVDASLSDGGLSDADVDAQVSTDASQQVDAGQNSDAGADAGEEEHCPGRHDNRSGTGHSESPGLGHKCRDAG